MNSEHGKRNGVEGIDYVVDLDGKRAIVGDRVAYAVTDGRSGAMRIGKVIEIVPKREKYESWDTKKEYSPHKVPTKLRIEVQESTGYGTPAKPVLIESGFKRFVRLG